MRHKIIFIGGVHGVGKTTLCKSVSSEFNIKHYSASELIKKYSNIKFEPNARVKNINRNQDMLIQAINTYLEINKIYILDGHFCLLNQASEITKIPLATFTQMAPSAIILLHNNPNDIYSRLKDQERYIYDVGLLTSFQDQELQYSRFVANKLGIPYLKAKPLINREIVDDFIADLIG